MKALDIYRFLENSLEDTLAFIVEMQHFKTAFPKQPS